MSNNLYTAESVLEFWFQTLTAKDRFSGDKVIDKNIKEQFLDTYQAVVANECATWRESPTGALAEIIVLDQFTRHLFRDTATAFACDGQALALAQVAVARRFDRELTAEERLFMYMPYMHSESRLVHETALALFTSLGNQEALKYEQIHKDIIDRFGRYPHRNEQLGRASTAEELRYLAENQEDFFGSSGVV